LRDFACQILPIAHATALFSRIFKLFSLFQFVKEQYDGSELAKIHYHHKLHTVDGVAVKICVFGEIIKIKSGDMASPRGFEPLLPP
jgi:hypothetical protein